MSVLKIFLFLSIYLIFVHGISYSQEKTETSTTQKEDNRTVLIFSAQEVDKEVLDALASELPRDTFAIGTKEGKTVFMHSGKYSGPSDIGRPYTMELKEAKETTGLDKTPRYFVTELESLVNAFREFKVDQIELWIQVAGESGGVLKLVASAKGEAGMRIVLKPKQ